MDGDKLLLLPRESIEEFYHIIAVSSMKKYGTLAGILILYVVYNVCQAVLQQPFDRDR